MIYIRNGKYKKKKLENTLDPLLTRPTKDRVKEGLFNVLSSFCLKEGKRFSDLTFLDIFSGTGQIGIEALSLDFKFVYFNDLSKESYDLIRKNVSSLKLDKVNYKIFNKDYNELINILKKEEVTLDIIFLDPPYKTTIPFSFFNELKKENIINQDTLIIYEEEEIKNIDPNLTKYLIKEYKYGRSKLFSFKIL